MTALVFSAEPVLAVPDKLSALSGPDAVAALVPVAQEI
jgi:phosphoribosylcarboxyaminoimidazole (NCAIR) mutase